VREELEHMSSGTKSIFKEILLNECQEVFEANLDGVDIEASVETEAFEKQLKKKNKVLGNIMFIGELLKASLLSSKIFLYVADDLRSRNTDFTLEGLVKLLEIVCPYYKMKAKAGDESSNKMIPHLSQMMDHVRMVAKDKTGPHKPRTRFMLMDLVDKHELEWAS
jgi:hypothetical protein